MKSVSVLNMSHSGMQLHFYSLTLDELKLISWTCCFSVAPTAGCRLLTLPALKTFPSFHLIWGLDLIKDSSWTISATAVQSSFFFPHPFYPPPLPPTHVLLNLHKADGILARDSSDSPTFHEHSKDELQHIRKTKKQTNQKNQTQSQNKEVICWLIYTDIPATVASVSRSTMGIVSFQKIFKITFSYCHWLVSIYKQYTSTHLVSNVILLCTKITTDLQQDKDMFFLFSLWWKCIV